MYGYQWAGSLSWRYCRSKHYLMGDILKDDRFTKQDLSYGTKLMFDGCSYDPYGHPFSRSFYVGILYDPKTYEIKSFDCRCENNQGMSHARPYSTELHVNSYEKNRFYDAFNPFVTKDPEAALASWMY